MPLSRAPHFLKHVEESPHLPIRKEICARILTYLINDRVLLDPDHFPRVMAANERATIYLNEHPETATWGGLHQATVNSKSTIYSQDAMVIETIANAVRYVEKGSKTF